MNLFYGKDGEVSYSKEIELYSKKYKNDLIYFPNKYRLSGSMVNHKLEMHNLLNSYCLDDFEIEPGDTVLDCGANIGAFLMALNEFEKDINYIAFEPDANIYECLKLNTKNSHNVKLYNFGLSNLSSKNTNFYIDSDHGDSSLEKFNSNSEIKIETKTLDELKIKKIKLLKIDAEGHELEVLLGSKKTLKEIEYITIDVGEESKLNKITLPKVNNFLLKNKFELIDFNKERITGLYKNTAI
tara:strand:- start:100 stop:822 length:723 start_codon:yes stop_codon:yes gene_type:complete